MRKLEERKVVVYDPLELHESLHPLTLTRPSFDLLVGTMTNLERIERSLGTKAACLLVPDYLEASVRESHPECTVNEAIDGPSLVINGALSPEFDLASELRKAAEEYNITESVQFIDSASGMAVFSFSESIDAKSHPVIFGKQGKKKAIRTGGETSRALLDSLWSFVSVNGRAISSSYSALVKMEKWKSRGKKRVLISESAELGDFVVLDSQDGPIIVDDESQIESFSFLKGPCYVGKNTKIASARIRSGTTIGSNCKIAGEIEESIISSYTNKSHEGFIGHSILGFWVNLGAMTTNSDLKNTYGTVKVQADTGKTIDTHLMKVGCFLGDMSKTSIGTLIYTGKKVGVSSQVFGTVIDNVPSFSLYQNPPGSSNSREFYIDSAIETQRRMMSRRGVHMTKAFEQMMRAVFQMTQKQRNSFGVRSGRFSLS